MYTPPLQSRYTRTPRPGPVLSRDFPREYRKRPRASPNRLGGTCALEKMAAFSSRLVGSLPTSIFLTSPPR
ncbi:hypothetical protein P154DRAFT_353870 [Amniculicola lignicola CBS 123094]|uniref:Uncharacterized protein n=1 Tax=Amniculicola lignicola CBS 123094 TaxID=1392246 RepID=A0A6A5WTK1_9PLEO|nr:hypothetical protein P154DRAFT_353870 [Amniculicola lignicola CBS 123094]